MLACFLFGVLVGAMVSLARDLCVVKIWANLVKMAKIGDYLKFGQILGLGGVTHPDPPPCFVRLPNLILVASALGLLTCSSFFVCARSAGTLLARYGGFLHYAMDLFVG